MPVTTEFRVEGAEETVNAIQRVYQEYRRLGAVGQEQIRLMRQQATAIYAARRSVMLIRTEYRMTYATLLEFNRGLRRIGIIGRQIISIWQAHTIAMMRLQRAHEDVREAQEEVAKYQQEYNEAVRVFGEQSVYAQDALEKLTRAQKRLRDAQAEVARAQQENIIGYIGIAFQIAGMIPQFAMLGLHLTTLSKLYGLNTIAALKATAAEYAHVASVVAHKVATWFLNQALIVKIALLTAGVGVAIALTAATMGLIRMEQMHAQEIVRTTSATNTLYRAQRRLNDQVYIGTSTIRDQTRELEEYTRALSEAQKFAERVGHPVFPSAPTPRRPTVTPPTNRPIIPSMMPTEVKITNYFTGDINSEVDLESAGRVLYRKMVEEMEKYW